MNVSVKCYRIHSVDNPDYESSLHGELTIVDGKLYFYTKTDSIEIGEFQVDREGSDFFSVFKTDNNNNRTTMWFGFGVKVKSKQWEAFYSHISAYRNKKRTYSNGHSQQSDIENKKPRILMNTYSNNKSQSQKNFEAQKKKDPNNNNTQIPKKKTYPPLQTKIIEKENSQICSHNPESLKENSVKENNVSISNPYRGLILKPNPKKETSSFYQTNLDHFCIRNLDSSLSSVSSRVGMKNTGNSCYFNAIIQALISLPTFLSDLIHPRLLPSGLEELSLHQSLLSIAEMARKSHNSAINPTCAQNAISRHCSRFANKRQQDAHELLGACLNILEKELLPFLNSIKDKQVIQEKKTKLHTPWTERGLLQCPIKRNFSFIVLKEIICSKCKEKTCLKEIFRDLSLDTISGETIEELKKISSQSKELREWLANVTDSIPLTINQLIDFYFLPEEIERTCENCGNLWAQVYKYLYSLPRIIILHLKRFRHTKTSYGYIRKIHDQVHIHKELYLESHVMDPVQEPIPFEVQDLAEHFKIIKEKTTPMDNNIKKEVDDSEKHRKLYLEKLTEEEQLQLAIKESKQECDKGVEEELGGVDMTAVLPPAIKDSDDNGSDTESMGEESKEVKEFNELFPMEKETPKPVLSQLEELSELDKINFTFEKKKQTMEKNSVGLFNLHSLVIHRGVTASSGHYVSNIVDEMTSEWHCFDDSTVRIISEKTAIQNTQKEAYILFYVHHSVWLQTLLKNK